MLKLVLCSLAATATATDTTLFKVTDGLCGQATLDSKYASYAEKFAGLAEGTCASVGYTVADGSKTLKVPVLGDITIQEFKKPAEGGVGAEPPCCEGSCSTAGEEKYWSIAKSMLGKKHCGECCMDPSKYPLYHVFEKNLTKSATASPCKGFGYTQYDSTVTHGFGPIKMTLDLYDEPSAEEAAADATPASLPLPLSLSLLPRLQYAPETASSVCVHNSAWFVLKWRLHDTDTGAESGQTGTYPVGETKCMAVTAVGAGLVDGASVVPKVDAILGREITAGKAVLYDKANATQITYVCKGTTEDFSCEQGPPPATAGNVTKAVGDFLVGFAEGLGQEIGFTECLADISATFHDITTIVDFFENGINGRVVHAIVKAFELLGGMLKDLGQAIAACVKDAQAFAAKMKSVGKALSGDAMAIIKVVIDELVHIFHERAEITADCKTTVTSWRGGDYLSSGKAVGDIVGIIMNGL